MKKYPISLFIGGFVLNAVVKFFYLFLPALILIVIGIWVKVCLFIGLALMVTDFIVSLIYQLLLRKSALESDDGEFSQFQDAMFSPDWKDNVKNAVEEKIQNYDNSVK